MENQRIKILKREKMKLVNAGWSESKAIKKDLEIVALKKDDVWLLEGLLKVLYLD